MDSKIYLENIDEILNVCWEKSKIKKTMKNQTNSNSLYSNTTTPFALKSFQTMYSQFLYKQSLRKKIPEKKKDDLQIVNSFEELDKLTKNSKDNEE